MDTSFTGIVSEPRARLSTSLASANHTGNGTIRIVIADDQQVFAQGLATMLSQADGVHVIGITDDGEKLLEIVVQQRPDVATLEITMQDVCLAEMLGELSRYQIATRVLVLTSVEDPRVAEEALGAGACGYMLKTHAFHDILTALRSVALGKKFVSPRLVGPLLDRKAERSLSDGLTARQLEVLRLVAAGDTSKRIAKKLGIHVKTVDNHRNIIREKLGVHSTAEMVRVASQRSLI